MAEYTTAQMRPISRYTAIAPRIRLASTGPSVKSTCLTASEAMKPKKRNSTRSCSNLSWVLSSQ